MGLSKTMASSICIGPMKLASAAGGTLNAAESPLGSTFVSSLVREAVVVDEDEVDVTSFQP